MELGDLGADVVKVESLGGDLTRQLAPPRPQGQTMPFLALNRSKRSIALDYGRAEGADVVRRLIAGADVVVESFDPGRADELGLGESALRAVNPQIIYATVTPFGQDGPYRSWRGSEIVLQALSAAVPNNPAGDPDVLGGDLLELFTGKFLFHGIVAALIARARSGVTQRVDVSGLESAMARAMSAWPDEESSRDPRGGLGPRIWAGSVRAFATRDVPIEFNFRVQGYTPNDEAWMAFFRDVGADALVDDVRFATEGDRAENFLALKADLEPHLAQLTAYEVMDLVSARDGMAAPWHTLDMALRHPQAAALDMVVDLEHETLGSLKMVAPPYEFLGSPAVVDRAPPTLGQHTLEILQGLGYDEPAIVMLVETGVI
jgi:crotonobetainyl-CoA:carnitine CoA-transferase CaiB-like acyl-CoA transferase